VLLVYDVTNKSSFDALDSWIDEMKHELGNAADIDNTVFVVCANKVRNSHLTGIMTNKQ
jgi:DnaJ homolog subfamily C member 27